MILSPDTDRQLELDLKFGVNIRLRWDLPAGTVGGLPYYLVSLERYGHWRNFMHKWNELRAEDISKHDFLFLPTVTHPEEIKFQIYLHHLFKERFFMVAADRLDRTAREVAMWRSENGPRAHIPVHLRARMAFHYEIDRFTLVEIATATGVTAMSVSKWTLWFRKRLTKVFHSRIRGVKPIEEAVRSVGEFTDLLLK